MQLTIDSTDKLLAGNIGVALVAYAKDVELVPPYDCTHPKGDHGIVAGIDLRDGAPSQATAPAPETPDAPPPPPAGPTETSGPETPPPAPDTTLEVDEHGVAFNADFCGKSKEPFYGSGANKGQWKKRRGVAEDAYSAWYGSAKVDAVQGNPEVAGAAEAPAVDPAGAFAGEQAPPPPAGEDVPKDCGAFMVWVSAQQAANNVTQDDVTAAYQLAGLAMTDLFPPNDATVVEANVAKLHSILTGRI